MRMRLRKGDIIEYDYFVVQNMGRPGERTTDLYHVWNRRSRERLGVIGWHGQWRQYVFWPDQQVLFSIGCLRDLADAIDRIQVDYKSAESADHPPSCAS
jgi:hypothetical protein